MNNISEGYYFCSRFVCEQLAKYFKIEVFKVDESKSGMLKLECSESEPSTLEHLEFDRLKLKR